MPSGTGSSRSTAFAAEPVRAREALRDVFENGQIAMHPGEDGTYVAKATFLPLAAIVAGDLAGRVTKPLRHREGPM